MLFNPSHNYYKKDDFDNSGHLFVHKKDVILHLPARPATVSEPVSEKLRGNIKGFSKKSRRRAIFVAQNSYGIKTQFCCTYHNAPHDGELVKTHLNHFLTTLRQKFPGLKYFWFLEFQERGAPHYHVCTSIDHEPENHSKLVNLWLHASGQSDELAVYKVHSHQSNFIKWDLNGSYVAKYLNKESQKDVPANHLSVGRFWGASRGLAFCISTSKLPAKVTRLIKNFLLAHLKLNGIKYKVFNNIKRSSRMIINLNTNSLEKIFDFYGPPPLIYNVNNI